MKIELNRIAVRNIFNGFLDSAEEGVVAFDGKLDIRPKYQREFVYTGKQRDAVLETVKSNYPLNVMYWMVKADGFFEVLDGQQRTLSICQYVNGDYSLDNRFFDNLTEQEQNQILDYELMIYFCEGTEIERLNWFRIINIAGAKLTDQELLNAVYTGPWLSDAKLKFSKPGCAAYKLGNDHGALMKGSPIRQEYLETVLSWINDDKIADYMARHQHDENATELWEYFTHVIEWVRKTFIIYRKEMVNVNWGFLYNNYKNASINAVDVESEIAELMQDEDVTSKSGIYSYVLTRKENYLSIRLFNDKMKREAFERQKGTCIKCKKLFKIEEMEADHVTPWHEGGKTIASNCQMLCIDDNRRKSGK
jgi:hypothetical protein